jgi:hypothetical protein
MLQRDVTMACFAVALAASTAGSSARAQATALADADVRALLVRASVALYKGVCPCPWSFNREHQRCGEASAFNRKLSEAPVCFAREITREQVARYRALLADEQKPAK